MCSLQVFEARSSSSIAARMPKFLVLVSDVKMESLLCQDGVHWPISYFHQRMSMPQKALVPQLKDNPSLLCSYCWPWHPDLLLLMPLIQPVLHAEIPMDYLCKMK
ncbi:uncharacterized protein LOC110431034 isoform X2 [Sorghum bicolor]|uniref:uncharacterized protein LOC110431034 isoform X2 n=1 Tax=Sorghum bicolor TaxID=4558 RepID=UPI000B423C2A|nr:uncharacterized protein LOC110431034 isoform X2 [Sorghum bicolor]|eukprot:XP_021305228.1 uncharacterized protein LOC110431034 isoform X2 [Sorghum bicolor]